MEAEADEKSRSEIYTSADERIESEGADGQSVGMPNPMRIGADEGDTCRIRIPKKLTCYATLPKKGKRRVVIYLRDYFLYLNLESLYQFTSRNRVGCWPQGINMYDQGM